MENAIDLPSGDQRASATLSVARVTWVAGPSVSIQRTKICGPRGSPSAIYSMRFPSADQRGLEPFVRNRCWPPSAFMIQREESHRSSILFTCWRRIDNARAIGRDLRVADALEVQIMIVSETGSGARLLGESGECRPRYQGRQHHETYIHEAPRSADFRQYTTNRSFRYSTPRTTRRFAWISRSTCSSLRLPASNMQFKANPSRMAPIWAD